MSEIEKICPNCQHYYEGDGWVDAKECSECTHAGGFHDWWVERVVVKVDVDEGF